jgi:hypothetical protein
MSITYYASGSILNNVFGAVGFTPPANYYLGLSTTTISSSGSNATEPTGGKGYARVAVANNKSNFSYASSGCLVIAVEESFPESTASWGTVSDIFLADTSGSATGNVWFYQALSSPKVIQEYTTNTFSGSSIAFSMTN